MVARGLPPGTAGEPSQHAGEEQGERDSECVEPTSYSRGISRIEETNDAIPGEKVSFERERQSNALKGKSKVAVQYRDDGMSGFSDYEWEEESKQHD